MEENTKITVSEFVEKINSFENEEEKYSYIEDTVIKTRYINYEEKDFWAKSIVKNSCYATDDPDKIEINSNRRWFLTMIMVITAYTNVEFDTSDDTGLAQLNEFDLMDKYGMFEMIIGCLPAREINRMNEMIDRAFDDFKENNIEPHAFLLALVDRLSGFGDTIGDWVKQLMPSLNTMMEHMNSEDLDKIIKIIMDVVKA